MATPVTETVRATGRATMPADHKTGLWVGLPADQVGERGAVGVASGEAPKDVVGGKRRWWQRR